MPRNSSLLISVVTGDHFCRVRASDSIDCSLSVGCNLVVTDDRFMNRLQNSVKLLIFLTLSGENPRSPGSSFCSCSQMASMAPVFRCESDIHDEETRLFHLDGDSVKQSMLDTFPYAAPTPTPSDDDDVPF